MNTPLKYLTIKNNFMFAAVIDDLQGLRATLNFSTPFQANFKKTQRNSIVVSYSFLLYTFLILF